MLWTRQVIFFVDFEGSHAAGVLEYGVASVLGGQVVETKTRLCAATGRVRAEDTAVHGLREERLAAERPLADDWEYFAGLREKGPLAAHYAGAENALLKSVWPYPRPSPDFMRPGDRLLDWGPWIDSARICAQYFAGHDSGRLESIVAVLGLQAELDGLAAVHCPADRRGYHAALYDALAGALILCAVARDPRGAGLTLRQVFALSTLDGEKRDAMTQEKLW
jgi:DNA polymerase III epsilon subunit-like protein